MAGQKVGAGALTVAADLLHGPQARAAAAASLEALAGHDLLAPKGMARRPWMLKKWLQKQVEAHHLSCCVFMWSADIGAGAWLIERLLLGPELRTFQDFREVTSTRSIFATMEP